MISNSEEYDWCLSFEEEDMANEEEMDDEVFIHESIKSRQREKSNRLFHPIPSKEEKVYWIYEDIENSYPHPTINSGKWLIFQYPEHIDAAWDQIKYGLKSGMLGSHAKCSTLLGWKGGDFVICVYTFDWKDEVDVLRIRESLRELGFTKPLPYKADADTLRRVYSATHKNISKYYE